MGKLCRRTPVGCCWRVAVPMVGICRSRNCCGSSHSTFSYFPRTRCVGIKGYASQRSRFSTRALYCFEVLIQWSKAGLASWFCATAMQQQTDNVVNLHPPRTTSQDPTSPPSPANQPPAEPAIVRRVVFSDLHFVFVFCMSCRMTPTARWSGSTLWWCSTRLGSARRRSLRR